MINYRNSAFVFVVLLWIGFNAKAGAADELLFTSQVAGHAKTLWRNLESDLVDHRLQVSTSSLDGQFQLGDADIVELNLHDAIAGCDSGALNLLPWFELLPGNNRTRRRYIANSIQPCAVGHSVWAEVVAFDQRRFSSVPSPYLLSDFFNLDEFPGRRAIKKSARGLFEWILIDQGFSPDDVYQTLSMDSSWKTIHESLNAMRENIVWVDTDKQALELLDSGLVTYAAVSSHNLARRVFTHDYMAKTHYGVIWHGAIAHMNFLALPKAENSEQALQVLRFAIEPERNLKASTESGYAPVRADQAVLIKERYRQLMPIAEHLDNVLWGNSRWWREQGGNLESRFYQFLDGFSYVEIISAYDEPGLQDSGKL